MRTYNAIFHAEAQLKFRIWSPDNCHGDGRTVDDAEPHILLAFLILSGEKKGETTKREAQSRVRAVKLY